MNEKERNRSDFIIRLSDLRKNDPVGNKAVNLSFMLKHGYKIPNTLTCVFDAYEVYKTADSFVLTHIKDELSKHIQENQKYSVRSSANIEDATSYSFAGQFSTQLNVEGSSAILEAIQDVWKSAEKASENEYIKEVNNESMIKMGVIIQEMVDPIYSGVVFTKNPLTGLDEVIVESVDGYGVSLVQEGVTPDRWLYKWGEWKEKPDHKDERLSVIERVIQESTELAKLYGSPLDLEWCYDGQYIYWLQLRAITTLESTKLYSNRMSREFLPGLIKPLVWSVNTPMINSSWKELFREVIGSAADSIDIHKLTKQFYYRAYFNMGIIGDIFEVLGMPREALEILAGIESAGEDKPMFKPSSRTFVHLPRMLTAVLRKLMFSKSIEIFLREYQEKYNSYNEINLGALSYQSILHHIDELYNLNRYGSYMVIVSQLLNSLYNMMLNGMLSRYDIAISEFPLAPKTNRLRESDPRYMLDQLRRAYSELNETEKNRMEQEGIDTYVSKSTEMKFSQLFLEFMKRFGHLSDSGNDFSRRSWRETPDLVINMIKSQQKEGDTKSVETPVDLNNFLREKRMNRTIYQRAMRYQEYRELVNALYTFGYSQFRRFFLQIALLLQKEKKIEEQEDIFYLTHIEIRNVIQNRVNPSEARKKIQQRRQEMEEYADIILPEIIIGDSPPLILDKQEIGMELSGVATSGGHYTGPAKVVRGIGDFGKITEGDVLVIPYSDVSWTPLFSMAKAVISESGGLLSHCSIVAREYGIPAVVSVAGAMQIEDGSMLAINGDNGEIAVLKPR